MNSTKKGQELEGRERQTDTDRETETDFKNREPTKLRLSWRTWKCEVDE